MSVRTESWKVVLAAGAGRRLQSVTGGIPKQFWRCCGDESLLECTLDRFDPLAARTVVIVDEAHRTHLAETSERYPMGTVVVQPQDRGTAAGVLLALTPVLESEPEAIVILTPADHGIMDPAAFRARVASAVSRVRDHRDDIVLFGVRPASPRQDYGWISIQSGDSSGPFSRIRSFVEKPDWQHASRLFQDGALWNTMVLVATASTLWSLYAELLPELTTVMSEYMRRPASDRQEYLSSMYSDLPRHDFSRDVIGRANRLFAHVLPASVGWTDLGTPERLNEWQQANGCRPVRIPCPAHEA
jgi:mannose-1-phosphate guanylyltransferase